jgi:hypothetical protein
VNRNELNLSPSFLRWIFFFLKVQLLSTNSLYPHPPAITGGNGSKNGHDRQQFFQGNASAHWAWP